MFSRASCSAALAAGISSVADFCAGPSGYEIPISSPTTLRYYATVTNKTAPLLSYLAAQAKVQQGNSLVEVGGYLLNDLSAGQNTSFDWPGFPSGTTTTPGPASLVMELRSIPSIRSISSVTIPVTINLAESISGYSAQVLADNPAGYWRLNERAGATAVDSSGNGRHGTYVAGVTLGAGGATSDSDASAKFDGTSGYVQIPGVWGGSSSVTVEAWVNLDATTSTSFQAIIGTLVADNFVHLQLNNSFGNNAIYTNNGPVLLPMDNQTNNLGSWHHVAVVGQNGSSIVYKDGQPLGTINTTPFATTIPTPSVGFRIGAGNQADGGRYLNGRIDEVAIYDHILPASAIQRHYNSR